jgi:hypothetical protein
VFNDIAEQSRWSWLWWWLFCFGALLVLAFAVIAFVPLWPERVAQTILNRPGAAALAGIIGVLLTPVIAALLLVSIIGMPLGILILAMYMMGILLSAVFVAYLIGSRLPAPARRTAASEWLRMAVGVLLISILLSLPWLSGIAQVAILLIGFGGLLLQGAGWMRSKPPAIAASSPPL